NTIYNIQQDNKLTGFVEYCLKHSYKVLSSNFQNANSDKSINEIQKNFNPKLVPFSSKCYNLISDNYALINWQKDINNGYEWQWNWYKNIRYGNNNGADIKVPWELGRMQHLPIL